MNTSATCSKGFIGYSCVTISPCILGYITVWSGKTSCRRNIPTIKMASKFGTANIMWTYELSTDDHEAISFHMGYAPPHPKINWTDLSCSHAIKNYPPPKKKKRIRISQAAKKKNIYVEKYFKVFWKVMLCWLGVT